MFPRSHSHSEPPQASSATAARVGNHMGDGVRIRPAEYSEAEVVLELWSTARSAAVDVEDTRHDVKLLLSFDPGSLLVADVDAQVVASAVVTWDGWRGGIHRLVVLPAYRRRGIARQLVEAAHERLRCCGAKRANILIAEVDEGAGDLWRSAGYRTDPLVARHFRDL